VVFVVGGSFVVVVVGSAIVVSFVVVIGSFEVITISSFFESIGKFTGLLGVIPMDSVSSCSFVMGFSSIVVVLPSVVDGSSTVVVPNNYNLFYLYAIIFIYDFFHIH